MERFLTKVHRRYQPDWYFIPILLIGFLPWSLAVVQSWFANLFGRPGREDGSRIFHSFQPGNFQPRRLLALWSLVIFAFFSLSSSKLPSYILPIFPALAILAGDTLANISRRALLLHLLVATALAAAALALLPQAAHLNTVNAPADLVPRYVRWLTVAAALWLAAGVAALWQTLRHRPLGAVLTLAMRAGHDYVGTIRQDRRDTAFRRYASRAMNRLRERITRIKMTDQGCMLRAYSRSIIDAINSCQEVATFIPALAYTFARRPTEIGVAHEERHAGESKYSLYSLIRLNFDLMTGFSLVPLQFVSVCGMKLALKIDVDTYRGTCIGVPRLVELLQQHQAQATFLFSLGPDHTGRAIKRAFRPGFMKKVKRTSVTEHYGLLTLMYGTLLPGPDIGKRCAHIMQAVRDAGFDTGIHCWDHVLWQDRVTEADNEWTEVEMAKAVQRYEDIFGARPHTFGAAGWQMNAHGKGALSHVLQGRKGEMAVQEIHTMGLYRLPVVIQGEHVIAVVEPVQLLGRTAQVLGQIAGVAGAGHLVLLRMENQGRHPDIGQVGPHPAHQAGRFKYGGNRHEGGHPAAAL